MLQLCRTCHSEITTNDFIAIHDTNVKSTSVKSQLMSCIPELQLYLLKDPVLCAVCVGALSLAYSFKTRCLQTEERIRNYFLNTKLSEKSITLMELYKQVTAVGNSLELEVTVVKSSNNVAGNDPDAENDRKDFVVEQVKKEIYDTNNERTVCLGNLLENTDNNTSSECNITSGADIGCEDIIKEECDITQFKIESNFEEDNSEVENLSLLDEPLQRTEKQLKTSAECFVKFDGNEDLPQLQSGNDLKSNSSCIISKYRCERTEAESTTNEDLLLENSASNEIHTNEKPYKCDVCKFRTSLLRSLIKHMRTHTGKKPFRCYICQFRFVLESNLRLHMRSHAGEKPFVCSVCEFSTSRRLNLTNHMKSHTGEKSFVCSICKFSTYRQLYLTNHMKIHTGEKAFACSVCAYRAARKRCLTVHMRTHTGEKPYRCSICEFSAAQQNGLIRHMRIHTGEKPFLCSICEYRAAQQNSLTQHMRTHTSK